ncbi:hypothetical protein FTW19_03625 [Terriglobus albidus]|uniref:Uncharacterized protein n=1 Tax=Terriglobus albidus TaxID=1592106 RepID=A0A5B9E9A1_9BACT|nr:hypothetical protein [Terriglobus albidus]QEE27180.1 hypothetical protein FTW19_03625 [Terriglobus albidus]
MANKLIPAAERNLTPEEVEILDARRRRGQLLLVMGGQCLIVCIVLTLWAGQDATYSPGLIHPMVYWCILTGILALTFLLNGLRLRKGTNEFQSY